MRINPSQHDQLPSHSVSTGNTCCIIVTCTKEGWGHTPTSVGQLTEINLAQRKSRDAGFYVKSVGELRVYPGSIYKYCAHSMCYIILNTYVTVWANVSFVYFSFAFQIWLYTSFCLCNFQTHCATKLTYITGHFNFMKLKTKGCKHPFSYRDVDVQFDGKPWLQNSD